jgi:hypothetical protein
MQIWTGLVLLFVYYIFVNQLLNSTIKKWNSPFDLSLFLSNSPPPPMGCRTEIRTPTLRVRQAAAANHLAKPHLECHICFCLFLIEGLTAKLNMAGAWGLTAPDRSTMRNVKGTQA